MKNTRNFSEWCGAFMDNAMAGAIGVLSLGIASVMLLSIVQFGMYLF